jgi:hypothetical protein
MRAKSVQSLLVGLVVISASVANASVSNVDVKDYDCDNGAHIHISFHMSSNGSEYASQAEVRSPDADLGGSYSQTGDSIFVESKTALLDLDGIANAQPSGAVTWHLDHWWNIKTATCKIVTEIKYVLTAEE